MSISYRYVEINLTQIGYKTKMNHSELVDKGNFEPELETALRNYHPWRRFFARMIDYQISGLIFTGLVLSTRLAPDSIINPLQVQNTLQLSSSFAMGFFSMALWVVLEPLILSQFNNTPGKALLRLKLVPNDEHSSYWKRSFSVWAVGLGFGIPLIETFAAIIAATRLKKRGITDWDRWYGFSVVADEFGFKLGLVALVPVALVVASNIVLMSDFEWFGEKNTNQIELNKDEASHKWDELDNYTPKTNNKTNEIDENSDKEMNSLLNADSDTANLPVAKRFPHLILETNSWLGNYNGAILKGKILPSQFATVAQTEWLDKFIQLMNKEGVTYREQIEYCFRWVEAQPQDAKAWEILGRICKFGNIYDEAMDAFKSGLRINPRSDVAWYYLGEIYEQKNYYNEAIVAYKQAVRVNPENDGAWHFLGEDYEHTNQFIKAIDAYQQVVRINPKFGRATNKFSTPNSLFDPGTMVSAWTSLGDAYKKTNQIDKAFYAFQQALLINPDEPSAWYSLGETYALNGNQNKLLGVYNRLKTIDPDAANMFSKEVLNNAISADKYSPLDSIDLNEKPREPVKSSKQQTGTAFTVSSEGHALTNHHVINGCTEVKVAGREGLVKVITSDSVNDLALLQLPGHIDSYAKLNPDTRKLRQGEDIIVFGYPLNFALSSGGNLTLGILSALSGLGNNTNQIQITAPIQPGSSGSPVMDKKANVVGVVSMKLDDSKMTNLTGQIAQNVNFAVNGQTVKAFLDANKVPYKTGGGFFSSEKNNADIADEARKWTVLVECWK